MPGFSPVFMSQAASSSARNRRSNALEPRPLAVVAVGTEPTVVDLEAPIDDDSRLPLIFCPDCKDVRVFTAITTYSDANRGKRYFKCPRKNYRPVSEVVEFALAKFHSCLPKFDWLCLHVDAGEMFQLLV